MKKQLKLIGMAVALGGLVSFASCSKDDDPAPTTPPNINVTGVTLNQSTATISINGTANLTATVAPANATNKAVTWTSSNTGVATVSTTGVVTGVATGTATITVKTTDGAKVATCAIEVIAGQVVNVTGVTLNQSTATISINGTANLTATVAPANATNKNVTWTSSNTGIATVNNGTVTGVATGTATITVTTADGGKTATCQVTVTNTATASMNVTFGETNWTAGFTEVTQSSSQNVLIFWGFEVEEQMPAINFVTTNASGIYDPTVYYFEYYENTYLQDENYTYGDWWAESGTITISSFTGTTVSGTATVTMFSAYEYYIEENDDPSRKSLTLTFTNLSVNDASTVAKAFKNIGKRNLNRSSKLTVKSKIK